MYLQIIVEFFLIFSFRGEGIQGFFKGMLYPAVSSGTAVNLI